MSRLHESMEHYCVICGREPRVPKKDTFVTVQRISLFLWGQQNFFREVLKTYLFLFIDTIY
jgi:hypothetical protein